MLEEFALRYSNLSDDQLRAVSYSLIVLGGIVGGITNRSVAEIRRAPYLATTGVIFLCVSVVAFAGMTFIVQALIGGFFWVILALEMAANLVAGFFIARIAAARSRDAYGHGRRAALAFIPLANLWLLTAPSKTEFSVNRAPTIPLLTDSLGVLSGLVLLAAGIGLSSYAGAEGVRRVDAASAAGLFNEVMLERTLAVMAAEVQTPLVVDEVTTLLRMEVHGTELRYVYALEPPPAVLRAEMRLGLLRQNCSHDGLSAIIDAGAILQHVYLRNDGSEVGVIEVSRQACGE